MLTHPGPLMLFTGIGYPEILLILFVALLVFGRRLPEVGRSLGRGLSEFKKGLRGVGDETEPEEPGTSEKPPGTRTAADASSPEEPAPKSGPDEGELKG